MCVRWIILSIGTIHSLKTEWATETNVATTPQDPLLKDCNDSYLLVTLDDSKIVQTSDIKLTEKSAEDITNQMNVLKAGVAPEQYDIAAKVSTEVENTNQDDCFIRILRKISFWVRQHYLPRFLLHCIYHSHGEHVLSFLCLLGGWIFIFRMPGVAILRCFRLFRMLWWVQINRFCLPFWRIIGRIL